jgi:hypothetical protein
LGSRILFEGTEHQVVAIRGNVVSLLDTDHRPAAVLLSHLLSSDGFAVLDGPARALLAPSGLLDGLSEEERAKARWWEGHLLEVETGRHPDPSRPVRPEYDPALPLADRQQEKVRELTAQEHPVSFRRMERMRRRYREAGLWGLVDKRGFKVTAPVPDVDSRILDAAVEIIAEHHDGSTTTATRSGSIDTLADRLDERYGDDAPALPSRATLYRLFQALDQDGASWGPAVRLSTAGEN